KRTEPSRNAQIYQIVAGSVFRRCYQERLDRRIHCDICSTAFLPLMCARNNWAYWPQPVSLGTSAIKRPHSGNLVATNQLFCLLGAVASRYWPTWLHREALRVAGNVQLEVHKPFYPSTRSAQKYGNAT